MVEPPVVEPPVVEPPVVEPPGVGPPVVEPPVVEPPVVGPPVVEPPVVEPPVVEPPVVGPPVVELVETTGITTLDLDKLDQRTSSISGRPDPASTDRAQPLSGPPTIAQAGSMAWTYILRCRDGSFYVGSTTNLAARIAQHHRGDGAKYTARRRPVTLVWSAQFDRVDEAFAFEKRVQGWGRAKRLALIEGRYADLPGLASSRDTSQRNGLETKIEP